MFLFLRREGWGAGIEVEPTDKVPFFLSDLQKLIEIERNKK